MNTAASIWSQAAALALGTLASEDLACITAGQLVRDRQLSAFAAIAACVVGIYLGDLGLWALGRLGGRRLLESRRFGRLVSPGRIESMGKWFRRNGWAAIFASRFLPGTRLPLYVAAGSIGHSGRTFALWSFVAVLAWTPLLVLGAAGVGYAVGEPFRASLGDGRSSVAISALVIFLALTLGRKLAHPLNRAKFIAKISRCWRWEFWPSWLFYLPVIPWIAWLAVRSRSATAWTAANPGIPQGGVVGESKFRILSRLTGDGVLPTALVTEGALESRIRSFLRQTRECGWSFPLILKPDASQRGAGLKLARSLSDVTSYFEQNPNAVIVQPYHPGPYEAGVFYYRLPGESSGRIFSITDKRFPEVVGDGASTLEELIWRHPRFRMQAGTFLRRHAVHARRVLERGESFRLAIAGNHCQGTMFRDGRHLWTPELERAIDAVARRFSGFYIGRFDVRYSDVDAFRAGRDLAVVELNGVTSESTNIYDPAGSLWRAYCTLFRQWELIYRIGNANRRRGIQQTTVAELVRSVREYYSRPTVNSLAD